MTFPADRSNSAIRLAVMAGDGIGPEITAATLAVLAAADRAFGLNLAFEDAPIGRTGLRALGSTLPDESFAHAKAADGVVMGPVDTANYRASDLAPLASSLQGKLMIALGGLDENADP